MPVDAGSRLGPYLLLAPIGAGGMGQVFRAHDDRLGRDVAIKILPEAVRSDAQRLRRFEQEARAIGRLNHPNVLVVHEFLAHAETPCIVTELLEGSSLASRLGKPLPQRQAIDYAAQICRGLAAAHEKGLIHRDLKPSNLFVSDDGRIKILDFGLAKAVPAPTLDTTDSGETSPPGPTTPGDYTLPGAIVGTAGYMAPEQARGEPVDHRADIFSLGAVFYEMLTGEPAFPGRTAIERAAAILNQEPADARLPPEIDRVVRRCLEKSPARRFQSARDLAFALEGLLDEPAQSKSFRLPRLPVRALLAALALIAAVAAGAFLWPRAPAGAAQWRKLTFRRGQVSTARFVPGGDTLLYGLSVEAEGHRIWSASPGNPEARPLLPAGLHLLAVSSRGELALGTKGELVMTLARVPLAGGAPREVLDNVTSADFSPDGAELAVTRNGGLLEYPMGKVILTRTGFLHQVRVSPRSDAIAIVWWPYGPADDRGSAQIVSREGRTIASSDGWTSIRGLAWAPGGDEVWFAAAKNGEGGARSLRALDRRGKTRLVANSPAQIELADIGPDGRALVVRDLGRRTVRVLAPGASRERDFGWFDGSYLVDLSEDGRRMLFIEAAEATEQEVFAFARDLDGSPAVRLGPGNPLALSPDGSAAAITDVARTTLTIVPTGAGQPRTLPAGAIAFYVGASWTREGLIVHGRERDHIDRMWICPIDGGEPRPFGPPGYRPAMRGPSNGREILAWDTKGSYTLVPLDGGPARPFRHVDPDLRLLSFSRDGKVILALRLPAPAEPSPWEVVRLDVATGAVTPFRNLEPKVDGAPILIRYPWAVFSADWSAYAYQLHETASDLYLLESLR